MVPLCRMHGSWKSSLGGGGGWVVMCIWMCEWFNWLGLQYRPSQHWPLSRQLCWQSSPTDHKIYHVLPTAMLLYNSWISTQLPISLQLTLPGDAQPWAGHTITALSLGPGRTQVTMFGGCPKFESGKSNDVQQKLAKTTVLEFGEQSTHDTDFNSDLICLLYWWLIHNL